MVEKGLEGHDVVKALEEAVKRHRKPKQLKWVTDRVYFKRFRFMDLLQWS
jgi:hypothetical protein